MEQAHREAEEASDRYEASGEDDDEYDEEGVLVSSTRGRLRWQVMETSRSQSVIREAFVVSIFHFWETAARDWTGCNARGFPKLRDAVLALGLAIDVDGLTLLNDINNLLKHDNVQTGERLYEQAPHLFIFARRPTTTHWRSALRFSNADVKGFIDVVRRSGPPDA